MNAYNPLSSTKRLEAAGLARIHAEAIAFEIDASTEELVTKDYLKDQLAATVDKIVIKTGIATVAIVGLACSLMGVLFSIK